MIYVIDSTVFLHLLFDEDMADLAEEILSNIESGIDIAYTIPSVLEEVAFKLLIGKLIELVGKKPIMTLRRVLKKDEAIREEAFKVVIEFMNYTDRLKMGGLRVEPLLEDDLNNGLKIAKKYGLFTADGVLVAFAIRKNIKVIATFDEDFKRVEGLKTWPSDAF